MSELRPGTAEVVLAFADDEHLMGQHYTEWIGVTPFLEEDLAFSSIGQDELGHAVMLYAIGIGDASADFDSYDDAASDLAIDKIALQRPAEEYRSCWFTERPTDDWAEAIVRHWLYDRAEELRWQLFTGSSVSALAEAGLQAEREERYHRLHGDGLLDVLLDDAEAAPRLRHALELWAPMALGLFEPVAGEADALADGAISAGLAELRTPWTEAVADRFGPVVWGEPPVQNQRRTRSAWFEPLMTRMREVIDLDPTAIW